MSQPIEPLEPRHHLAASPVAFNANLAHIRTVAGGDFDLKQTLRTEDRVYLLGQSGDRLAIAALQPDGTLYTRFGPDHVGIAYSPLGALRGISSMNTYHRYSMLTRDDAGSLYMISRGEVVKFLASGKRDLAFGTRGVMSFANPRSGLVINDALFTDRGELVIAAKTLHQGRETHYVYAVSSVSSALTYTRQRTVGSDLTFEFQDMGDHAFLRKSGDDVMLIHREERLSYYPDPDSLGLPYITQESNDLSVVRLNARLRPSAGSFSRIEIARDAEITDVRIMSDGQARVVLSGLSTIQFKTDGTIRRHRKGNDPLVSQARFTEDGSVAYLLGHSYFSQPVSVMRGVFGAGGDDELLATVGSPTGESRMYELQHDGTLLASQTNSRNQDVWQLIRPGIDGPGISWRGIFYYGHVPYQNITYLAPADIHKGSVNPWTGEPNSVAELIISSPGGESLVSGISGHGDGPEGYSARYWVNGPGGAWGPEDNGVYTVAWREASVMDALGVFNKAQALYTFTYDYYASVYG